MRIEHVPATSESIGAVARISALATALLLGACVQLPGTRAPDNRPPPDRPPSEAPIVVEPAPADPMADVRGDRPLPALQGEAERIDCMSGRPDLQARIAFEAIGGQVTNFAYYSRWSSFTCSLDADRSDPKLRWRLAPDGATRVQTPHGTILIRTEPDAYVFEFREVQRMKICGMFGRINGTMRVRRNVATAECSADGVLDR